MTYESGTFTRQIDVLELLNATIREHEKAIENRIADLENLHANLQYLRSLSRHESEIPGKQPAIQSTRGSRRGAGGDEF